MDIHCTEKHPHGEFHRRLDQIGAGASFLCAIHCLVFPLLAGLLPVFASYEFAENRTFEDFFVGISFLLATSSLILGYRHHGQRKLFILLCLSLALMFSSRFFVHSPAEVALLVSGAIGVCLCHILNRRYCRMAGHRHAA